MNKEDIALVERAVKDAVAKEAGISASEIDPAAALLYNPRIDDAGFYRIIVDIEQRLGISSAEGTWYFDEGSVKGMVRYYVDARNETKKT
jgi:hypothetical protein